MKRGDKFLVSTTMLAVAGCVGEQGKLDIRPTPTALAQGTRPVSQRVGEGRAQLALGNVGLALEAFRIALREDPNNIDALAGLAAGYDRMGRFDLSRRNYETALAIAPADFGLLGAFAQSLQLQGEYAEAKRVQQEIALRQPAMAASDVPQFALRSDLPVSAPDFATTVKEAPLVNTAMPMALTASAAIAMEDELPVEVAIPRPALSQGRVAVVDATALARTAVSVPNLPEMRVSQDAPPIALQRVEQAVLGPSVTIKLPAVRRAEAAAPARPAPVAMAVAPDLPPLKSFARPVPKPAVVDERGEVRLERLSMGEIGIITAAGPIWRTTAVARSDISTTVRFVPLRQASAYPARVQLLNAARVDRLAARTRNWLTARGWQGLAIGDARATRTRSVIYYPANQRALARRLSAQFGFAMAPRVSGAHITVLLGSDAARHPALRPRRA